jgi:pyruvate dehydrogenase E2 component (dihydrolipoamide acetyltransferase)
LAILGVTRTQLKPRPNENGEIEWRQALPLSLSYDHRIINGADAARFTAFLARVLEDPRRLEV